MEQNSSSVCNHRQVTNVSGFLCRWRMRPGTTVTRRPARAQHARTQSLTPRLPITHSIITGRMIAAGVSGPQLTVFCFRIQPLFCFFTRWFGFAACLPSTSYLLSIFLCYHLAFQCLRVVFPKLMHCRMKAWHITASLLMLFSQKLSDSFWLMFCITQLIQSLIGLSTYK